MIVYNGYAWSEVGGRDSRIWRDQTLELPSSPAGNSVVSPRVHM